MLRTRDRRRPKQTSLVLKEFLTQLLYSRKRDVHRLLAGLRACGPEKISFSAWFGMEEDRGMGLAVDDTREAMQVAS